MREDSKGNVISHELEADRKDDYQTLVNVLLAVMEGVLLTTESHCPDR